MAKDDPRYAALRELVEHHCVVLESGHTADPKVVAGILRKRLVGLDALIEETKAPEPIKEAACATNTTAAPA